MFTLLAPAWALGAARAGTGASAGQGGGPGDGPGMQRGRHSLLGKARGCGMTEALCRERVPGEPPRDITGTSPAFLPASAPDLPQGTRSRQENATKASEARGRVFIAEAFMLQNAGGQAKHAEAARKQEMKLSRRCQSHRASGGRI